MSTTTAAEFDDLPQLLTVEQVANFCTCHDRSVRRWIAQGRLAIVRVGSRIRITKNSLQGFLGL